MYLLVYDAPWKLRVGVLGKTSFGVDAVWPSPVKVPNRARAATTDQRSAAQNGQYSAPTYTMRGLPSAASGADVIALGSVLTLPTPTLSKVATGIDVTPLITSSLAAVVLAPSSLCRRPTATTIATTTTTARMIAPTPISLLRRWRAASSRRACSAAATRLALRSSALDEVAAVVAGFGRLAGVPVGRRLGGTTSVIQLVDPQVV